MLALKRDQVDYKSREVKVVGKGNKERIVFLTERAIVWLKTYLENRSDNHPSLFVTIDGRRQLKRTDIWRYFDRHRKLAKLSKPVRPHILRHTVATQLLFNGCPIGHIKEILGHSRLETTCRYYLGLDRRAAKEAHQKYLVYTAEIEVESQGSTVFPSGSPSQNAVEHACAGTAQMDRTVRRIE